MSIVPIRINGREYEVACDDGQEGHLHNLAEEVNDRLKTLLRGMRTKPGEGLGLLLTALMLADELLENRKEMEAIAAEAGHLREMVNADRKVEPDERIVEIENTMAITLEEIAARIEKIADLIEVS